MWRYAEHFPRLVTVESLNTGIIAIVLQTYMNQHGKYTHILCPTSNDNLLLLGLIELLVLVFVIN